MKRKLDISSKDFPSKRGEGVNPWTLNPLSQNYYEILKKRMNLPVYGFKEDLIEKVKNNQVVVIEGINPSHYDILILFRSIKIIHDF